MAQSALEKAWYRPNSWALVLLPVSWLFRLIAACRKRYLLSKSRPAGVPVVVVGNISVGGTGKTPLLLSLINQFIEAGFHPGVVSRGYGGKSAVYPRVVREGDHAAEVGDEPLLYAGKCPVVIDPDRSRAVQFLLDNYPCDVVFSDDGLQHYALHRDIEVAVIDASRGFGNGHCLPVGPLREPPSRLNSVDYVLINGSVSGEDVVQHSQRSTMTIEPSRFRHFLSGKTIPVSDWREQKTVHAIAGIGHPEHFVTTLKQLGFDVTLHAYPDHHQFTGEEFRFAAAEHGNALPVIITSKDAVKLNASLLASGTDTGGDNIWVLDVTAALEPEFVSELQARVRRCQQQRQKTPEAASAAKDQT